MATKKTEAPIPRSQVEKLMMEKGLKFLEFTRLSGISPQQLTVIINGKQKSYQLLTLQKLCDGLRCTPNDIYRGHVKFKEAIYTAPKSRLIQQK
jgi:DNA-binding Xre family transcriptional regulator